MDFLNGLFNFEDIEAKTNALLKDKYGKAMDVASGTYAGKQREAEANMDIQAQRQGILGTPLQSTLKARIGSEFARNKAQTLAGLGAQQASDAANLGMQFGMQKNQAKAELLSGIAGGIFSGLGTLAGKLMPVSKAV